VRCHFLGAVFELLWCSWCGGFLILWILFNGQSGQTNTFSTDNVTAAILQRHKKKLLGHDLWNEYRFYFSKKSITKWFGIPNHLNPNTRWSKLYSPPYLLITPKFIEVSTPSFISGLSAYHPDDRITLGEKSIYWKPGLIRDLLIKSKGKCKNCNCLLTDNFIDTEIHHIQPIKYKGQNKFTNLAALCKECHSEVSIAVLSKNIDQVVMYEQKKILFNISELLIVEAEQLSQTKRK
jgi:hypothetical protein